MTQPWNSMKEILRRQAELRGEDMAGWNQRFDAWERAVNAAVGRMGMTELERRVGQGQDVDSALQDMVREASAWEQRQREQFEAMRKAVEGLNKMIQGG